MSAQAAARHGGHGHGGGDPNHLGHGDTPISEQGPASKRIVVAYGFWIFLLSDIIMFAAIFAGYAAVSGRTAGGPSGADLFELRSVAIQTLLLLTSTLTCGLAAAATERRRVAAIQLWYAVTGVLGLAFLGLEVAEFRHMVAEGAGPARSAFLSAFFTLVGCHGLHVAVGLLWLATVMAQLKVRGFQPYVLRRAYCFNLFWHALDIVWVALFSLVYLWGLGS